MIKARPDAAKATFQVQTKWQSGDGFKITSTGKDFQIGGQKVPRREAFTLTCDFPDELGGRSAGPIVCEACMASLGSCITQTIVAYATMMGVKLDRVNIDTEGDMDIRGLTGVSDKVRPGAQEFRLNIHLESSSATKEQLDGLYEMGIKFSPAMDTLTHGTSIKAAKT